MSSCCSTLSRPRLAGTPPVTDGYRDERSSLSVPASRTTANKDPPIGNGRAISRLLSPRRSAPLALAASTLPALAETALQVQRRAVRRDCRSPRMLSDPGADRTDGQRCATTGLDGLDGLVVNVGIVGGWGLEHTGAEEWDRVFQVNVRAHYLTCKHALAVMTDGGGNRAHLLRSPR